MFGFSYLTSSVPQLASHSNATQPMFSQSHRIYAHFVWTIIHIPLYVIGNTAFIMLVRAADQPMQCAPSGRGEGGTCVGTCTALHARTHTHARTSQVGERAYKYFMKIKINCFLFSKMSVDDDGRRTHALAHTHTHNPFAEFSINIYIYIKYAEPSGIFRTWRGHRGKQRQ